jgi:Golgi phosphoprotein 3
MLSLPEELLLLALHDEKGKIVSKASTGLLFGLAGAVLLELTLQKRLALAEKNKLALHDDRLTGDEILDEAIGKIRQSKKIRKADHWVSKLSGTKKLKDRLLDRLVNKGILRKEEKKVLRVFPVKRYPTKDARPERTTREQIRAALLQGRTPDERTAMIVSLVVACDLINEIFPKGERRVARKRAKEIVKNDPVGKAVTSATQAVQAAVIASVVVIAAASSTH